MILYLRTLVFSLIVILLTSAAVNYWFDPFGYFRIRGWSTSELLGDRVWGEARTVKALALPAVQVETLLAGNSRVGYGIDVGDVELKRFLGTAYNAFIPGATSDDVDAYVRFAIRNNVPERLLVGLDFGQFYLTNNAVIPSFLGPANSLVDASDSVLSQISLVLWSTSALKSTRGMVARPADASLNGVGNITVIEESNREVGARASTQDVEKNIFNGWLRSGGKALYSKRLTLFGEILSEVCSKGVEVKLFISPLHVRQLLLIDSMKLHEDFLSWKRDMTDIVEQQRKAACAISLVDFSRVTSFTSESFPPLGDKKSSLEWYWESSHYKPVLGKIVIQRLWKTGGVPQGFGVDLSGEVIDLEISAARDELIQYRDSHPELVKELREVIMQNRALIR